MWLPDDGHLVLTAGSGLASGLAEYYFSARKLARAATGFVAGLLTGRPEPGPRWSIEPSDAAAQVARAWQIGTSRPEAGSITEQSIERVFAILGEQDRPEFHYTGLSGEVAIMTFDGSWLRFAQAGAIAVYRARGGVVESVAPIGDLAGELARAGEEPRPELGELLTSAVSVLREGPRCSEPLCAAIDLAPGDRLVALTCGARYALDDAEIARCLLSPGQPDDPRAIVEAVIAAVERSPKRLSRHPTAVAFVLD